jgi:ubiquinol-cytochrome c reductase iron-sulfur subunit
MTDEALAGARAVRAIGGLLLLATLGAVALGASYVSGGGPQLEGLCLAVALVSLGLALALWSRHLLEHAPHVEERPPLDEGAAEARALVQDRSRAEEIGRRRALVRLLGLAAASLGAAMVLPLRSLGPKPGRDALQTPWRHRRRGVTSEGRPVRADSVEVGGLVTMFPEGDVSASGQTVLIRVPSDALRLPKGREGWAPGGLVAYSKVCTHAGCPVGLYQSESQTLLCPCHQSVFDVLRGARPVSGPAAWPLPQLPLAIDADGFVRSAGDFSEPVGPGWWDEEGS